MNGELSTKISNRPVKRIGEFEFVVEQDQSIGMNVPVKIYANDTLISGISAEVEKEAGHTDEEEIDDNEHKSREPQAFKLFSEGKTPVQVVIALDIPADEVHTIYREYLELNGMYDVLQIYYQIRYSGKYSLPSFLRLHRIVNDLGMGEQQIIKVLELANHNQLQYLQDKVEYLNNEVKMLEEEKANCSKHLLLLNKRRDEYMESMYTYAEKGKNGDG